MDKNELKKQIEEVSNQIKVNSKDVHFADNLIDKLLSLKGQYDIEPTRIYIPEKDVVKEYDNDSFRFIKCKGCIMFHAKGGYSVIVKSRMRALFDHLSVLLDMKDRYEELSEEEKKSYDMLYSATVYVLEAPMFSASDDEMFFGIASDVIKRLNDFTDKALKKDLQEETHEENAEFENLNEVLNKDMGTDA